MEIGSRVVYVDPNTKPHAALVTALNGLHDGYISVVYVKPGGELAQVYDIPHVEDEARDETNPELPRYALNCWKYEHEEHVELPANHPNFDPPFKNTMVEDAKFETETPEGTLVEKAAEPDIATQLENA